MPVGDCVIFFFMCHFYLDNSFNLIYVYTKLNLGGDPMASRTYQIVMDEKAHAQLKYRAREAGVTMGTFIENMLAALELRVKRAYGAAGVDPAVHDCDSAFIRTLMLADASGLSEAELHREFEEIGRDTRDAEWTPQVKF